MSEHVFLRLYEELNDFLSRDRRKVSFPHAVQPGCTVGAVLMELKVPRDEVELVLVDGISVDFSYRLRGGERVSIYPTFEAFDISRELKVRGQTLRRPRFVLDVHLGKLARYLRMLGFDATWTAQSTHEELIALSRDERRILLSKDRALLRHGALTRAYRIRGVKARQQLEEVLARFDLYTLVQPFARCMRCNQPLEQILKEAALQQVDPPTWKRYGEFRYCPVCQRTYWDGSHVRNMRAFIQTLLASGQAQREAVDG